MGSQNAAAPFHIAELGFGTGLNFLVTLEAWRQSGAHKQGAKLLYSSFELYPLSLEQMRRALRPWPQLAEPAELLLAQWPTLLAGKNSGGDELKSAPIEIDDVELRLVVGDARATLPHWREQADAWFLDGFSPRTNPELWGAELMQEVFAHTRPGGGFSTYTAAGFVRRNLLAAGFTVQKVPGFAQKRHRLQGCRA